MEREGPTLESLTRRLAETPEDFLAEPRIGNRGSVRVEAVVNDLLQLLSAPAEARALTGFAGQDPARDRNRLAVTMLLCWLLADEWFASAHPTADQLLTLLVEMPTQLAPQVAAKKFVADPERREELARLVLARLGFRPGGETLAQAQDRLTSLSSTERTRVMQAARAAEQRARQIREALARKAAEESADKWARE
ncbi:MAG: hypothetical protein FD161_1793 [Limisphaerales bacterium]|nr:MAG: hypothetical protein FD161_1793 [Limisphaerales bacterium]TXT47533.1 MAG: hypothetical protein FD140_4230 [Limisphaerales bacterium]